MLDTAHKLRNPGGGGGPEIWMKMVTVGYVGSEIFLWLRTLWTVP